MTTTVSSKGQIVIPANLRKKYHLEPGTKVRVVEREGRIIIENTGAALLDQVAGKFPGVLEDYQKMKEDDRKSDRF